MDLFMGSFPKGLILVGVGLDLYIRPLLSNLPMWDVGLSPNKEEQKFEALVKKNHLSSSDEFWKIASNAFPRKSEKDLLSYYYNVFLIKRMRLLANSSADNHIDSDDDHYDDFLAV